MGKKKKRQSKRLRLLEWLIFFVLFTGLLVILAHVLVNHYERDLFNYAAARINRKSGGAYTLTSGYVDANLLSRSICFKNLNIASSLGQVPKKNIALLNAKIHSLTLKKISLYDLIMNKTLEAGEVDVSIGAMSVTLPGKEAAIGSLSGACATLKRVRIHLTRRPSVSVISFKRGQATFSEPVYNTSDGFYTFRARTLDIRQDDSSVVFTGFEMIPRYGKQEFARKKGYRSSRLHLKTGRVMFSRIDFKDLFKNRRFHCETLLIENPIMDIYRDKNVPKRRRTRPPKFPQQRLRDAKLQLSLDLVKVTGGKLSYTERIPGKNRTGTMVFNDVSGEITHVTNYPEKLESGVSLVLKASCAIMGQGLFRTVIKFPLADTRNTFRFSGTLGPTNMKQFNAMLVPAANARIERGKLGRLDFFASGDNRGINGEMRLRYRQLKVSLLKRKGSQKKRKFRSFLANMIIFESNPRRGKLRVGKIFYKKEKPMTFFTYIWKSLLSGFKSSLGLTRAKKKR